MVSQSWADCVWAKFAIMLIFTSASVKPFYQLTRELFWQNTIKVKSGKIQLREGNYEWTNHMPIKRRSPAEAESRSKVQWPAPAFWLLH